MKEKEFKALCRKVCASLDYPTPDALGDHGRITIDGVEIALFFDEQVNPDMLFCYVDMGPVPEAMRTDMYAQLLTMNLLSGAKTNGVYSLDPTSGNAIFVVHFMQPEKLDPQLLAQAFTVYANQTNSLREMLRDDAPEAAPSAVKAGPAASGRAASMIDLA
ncbi:CesT family type III secretion system chaperone [Noviherbaspirillum soli]|uniref:CesT family type III secretion system chaperone n=1 Tax=Noviherbaspirillum soli TaxID=1064518 RepID=UPI00188A667F|nr:CesT family type III secretion system chaperone [Noviherbaspirillum soli]